ncbi:hypothetical protein LINPERHAP2_LOCUS41027 [Linum perenne]
MAASPAGGGPGATAPGFSPSKVVKKAKTADVDGIVGRDITQQEKNHQSPARANRPWLVGDHYVVSEEWRPNFEPGLSQVNSIRVWVRLPGIPLENYDAAILRIIGDKIGKTVRVDGTTLFGNRGNYARICVEVDLHKPLLSKYRLRRRVRRIEYEGLHEICFTCGRYGHEARQCPSTKLAEPDMSQPMEKSFDNPTFKELDARPEIEEDFGPWMKAKKHMRRKRSSPKVVHSMEGKETGGSRFAPITEEVPSQKFEHRAPVADVPAKRANIVHAPSEQAKSVYEVGVGAGSTSEESVSVPKIPVADIVQQDKVEVFSSIPLELQDKQNAADHLRCNNQSSDPSQSARIQRATTDPILQQTRACASPLACKALDFERSPSGRRVGDKSDAFTLLRNKERNGSGGGGTKGSTQKWKGDPTKARPPP